ncbi:MAG TPA: hypothetical protein VEW48_04785 [Thermoanaerobaculia bacterium]|nr:hypothetical protein [Thermoanaerobaculia bacterium]
MEDHSVGRLLRELPRETARPGFTQRVLRRLDEPAEARSGLPRLAVVARIAAAAAVIALVVAGGAFQVGQSREAARTAEARRVLQEIRAEHDRLAQELRTLSEPPVVYLGGDERVDLVVGLDKVPAEDGPAPATYRVDTY